MKTTIFGLASVLVVILAALLNVDALSPPKHPPENMKDEYTLQNTVPLEYFYVDDTMEGEPTHFSFREKSIMSYIQSANKTLAKINTMILRAGDKADLNAVASRLEKELWLHLSLYLPVQLGNTASAQDPNGIMTDDSAIDHYLGKIGREGGRVLVVGSMSPWVEALFLLAGATEVVTVEYNKLTYEHPKLRTVAAEEFDAFYDCNGHELASFDYIVSMSSLDHDGLGRYGDTLNPNGDLISMLKLRSLLKPTGIFFMTVPIGPDVVVFNLHRRYGRIRLPKLLQGYRVVNRLGWKEEKLDQPANWRQTYEPVHLLALDEAADESSVNRCYAGTASGTHSIGVDSEL